MPCRDYGRDDFIDDEENGGKIEELNDRLDYFASMLCHVLRNAEEQNIYGMLIKANNEKSSEVHNWWRQHQKDDAVARFDSEFSDEEREAILNEYR